MPAAKKAAPKKAPKKNAAPLKLGPIVWHYFQVWFKLTRDMLGSLPPGSIYKEHIIESNKKKIEKANQLTDKIKKDLDIYRGGEIKDDKVIMDMQLNIKRFAQLVGETPISLPNDAAQLDVITQDIEKKFNKMVKNGHEVNATVFMSSTKGELGLDLLPGETPDTSWPILSGHMVLGNIKENIKIVINNGGPPICPSKTSVGETLALDIKTIHEYMVPNQNIKMIPERQHMMDAANLDGGKGTVKMVREILERPIHFVTKDGPQSAINQAEILPAGTEFSTILRVRPDSRFNLGVLQYIFSLGKNNGFGPWRGSGHKGAYNFKIKQLRDFQDPTIPEGWM